MCQSFADWKAKMLIDAPVLSVCTDEYWRWVEIGFNAGYYEGVKSKSPWQNFKRFLETRSRKCMEE